MGAYSSLLNLLAGFLGVLLLREKRKREEGKTEDGEER